MLKSHIFEILALLIIFLIRIFLESPEGIVHKCWHLIWILIFTFLVAIENLNVEISCLLCSSAHKFGVQGLDVTGLKRLELLHFGYGFVYLRLSKLYLLIVTFFIIWISLTPGNQLLCVIQILLISIRYRLTYAPWNWVTYGLIIDRFFVLSKWRLFSFLTIFIQI